MSHIVKAAKDVQVGDQIPENDGFLFNVIDVEIGLNNVCITMASEFSSIARHHTKNGGVKQNFKKEELLYVVD